MTIGQSSFIDAPFLYINGLNLTWLSNTTLQVGSGRARTFDNTFDIILSNNITINTSVNGINGLDTGSLANNTWYAIYVIYSSALSNIAPTACIMSSNITIPTLPFGYDSFRRIGWALTNGSAQILLYLQCGSNSTKRYQWDKPINVLTSGTNATFTPISLGSVLPPSFTNDFAFAISFWGGSTSNLGSLRPSGSSATMSTCAIKFNSVNSMVSIMPNDAYVTMIPGLVGTVPTIEYAVDTGTFLNVNVLGFTDYI